MRTDVPDENLCFVLLVYMVHGRRSGWATMSDPVGPTVPKCPYCKGGDVRVHREHRKPVLDLRCRGCRRVFNVWSGTPFQGTHRRPSELVGLLVGIAEQRETCVLSRSLACNRAWLVRVRRKLEGLEFVAKLKTHVEYRAEDINGVWLSALKDALRGGKKRRTGNLAETRPGPSAGWSSDS